MLLKNSDRPTCRYSNLTYIEKVYTISFLNKIKQLDILSNLADTYLISKQVERGRKIVLLIQIH